MNYIKHDIELFDYDKRYNLYSEHLWDIMKDDEKEEEYFEDREPKPIIGFTQCTAEKTGQIGTMF